MKTTNKLLTGLFAAFLIFSACGGGLGDDDSSATGDSSADTSNNESESDEDATPGTVTRMKIQYDFSHAVVLLSPPATTGGNAVGTALVKNASLPDVIETVLNKLTEDGLIEPAITVVEETVAVEDSTEDTFDLNIPAISAVVQSPAGDIYILYEDKFLFDGFISCQFFKYLTELKDVECVDTEVDSVTANNLQFDSTSNLFYLGRVPIGANSEQILRRKMRETGEITDITNQYVNTSYFAPLNDGSVVVSGTTETTGTPFLRRYTTANSVETILGVTSLYITRMWTNSDGKVYISGHWVIDGDYETGLLRVALNDLGTVTVTPLVINTNIFGDASYDGGTIDNFYETPDGQIFFWEGNGILRFEPDIEFLYSQSGISSVQTDGVRLYMAGVDATDQVLRSYTLTGDEAGSVNDILSVTDDDIEIYKFDVASDGLVYFTGLRFSDNQIVVGMIDTNNANEITYNIELKEQPDLFEVLQ